MAKIGRPNLYEKVIKPAIDSGKLAEMAADPNLNKRKIAKLLGVSYSVFMQAQKDFPQISDIFQKAKTSAVETLEIAAKKEATGYWITEEKIVTRQGADGQKAAQVEKYKRWCRPSAAMQIFLLSNMTHSEDYKGETVYSRDPALLKLREKELELKKEKLDQEDW